jgi:Putative glucoamylase/Protein of unknown function (DUF3131)
MRSRTHRRAIGAALTALLLGIGAVAGIAIANSTSSHRSSPPTGGLPSPSTSPLAQQGASNALTLTPAAKLTATQLSQLRQIASHTWAFLSGPDLDPGTHLPRNNIDMAGPPSTTVTTAAPGSRQDYTSPTEIGTWLTALVAARDLGLISATQAQSEASALLDELERLRTADGFFLRWYNTSSGAAIQTPSGGNVTNPELSSVDNGWMAQGLLVASQAFPSLSGFAKLLGAMQFQIFYDSAKNALFNTYTVGQGPSKATYNLAYGGPRIVDYLAIGSGQVPGRLWYGLERTPPPDAPQRQQPEGQDVTYTDPQNPDHTYTVFEGSYVYDGIRFVPTFAGSMYQALAPAMVYPEQAWSPNAFGLNDRNTALAQAAFGADQGLRTWGWAPATTPNNLNGYAQYGAPPLSTKKGDIPDSAVTAYAAFEALPVVPQVAMGNIEALSNDYPGISTPDGFADSVDPVSGEIAARYMEVSQATVLMSLDNAINDWKLTDYVEGSSYGARLEPYLSQEDFHIQGAPPQSVQPTTGTGLPPGGSPADGTRRTRTLLPRRDRPRSTTTL